MSNVGQLLTEFDGNLSFGQYAASFIGGLIGIVIVLAMATAGIAWLSGHVRWLAIVLSFFVLLGTLTTAVEFVMACMLLRNPSSGRSVAAWCVVSLKVVEVALFIGSLTYLYVRLWG